MWLHLSCGVEIEQRYRNSITNKPLFMDYNNNYGHKGTEDQTKDIATMVMSHFGNDVTLVVVGCNNFDFSIKHFTNTVILLLKL